MGLQYSALALSKRGYLQKIPGVGSIAAVLVCECLCVFVSVAAVSLGFWYVCCVLYSYFGCATSILTCC